MIAYALARNGKLIRGTLSESKGEAWIKAAPKIANATGLNWGSGPKARRSLAKRGFRITKVFFWLRGT